jgi:hypothetical protein
MSHGWSGWWLTYPSEKYDFVSWEYDIPNIWKIQNVPNHQPVDAWFDVFVLKIITSCGWDTRNVAPTGSPWLMSGIWIPWSLQTAPSIHQSTCLFFNASPPILRIKPYLSHSFTRDFGAGCNLYIKWPTMTWALGWLPSIPSDEIKSIKSAGSMDLLFAAPPDWSCSNLEVHPVVIPGILWETTMPRCRGLQHLGLVLGASCWQRLEVQLGLSNGVTMV